MSFDNNNAITFADKDISSFNDDDSCYFINYEQVDLLDDDACDYPIGYIFTADVLDVHQYLMDILDAKCVDHFKQHKEPCWLAWIPETGEVFICTQQHIYGYIYDGSYINMYNDIDVVAYIDLCTGPLWTGISYIEIDGVRFNCETGECPDYTQT